MQSVVKRHFFPQLELSEEVLEVSAIVNATLDEDTATSADKLGDVASSVAKEAEAAGIDIAVSAEVTPSEAPSNVPSLLPSELPSNSPSSPSQSSVPSETPSSLPSTLPSFHPSKMPSLQPSSMPSFISSVPSLPPSTSPSKHQSDNPSKMPVINASNGPSSIPSVSVSEEPICADDNSFRFENHLGKSCSQWVDKNPSKRCVKEDSTKNNAFVFQFCPQTCNRCCADDNSFRFENHLGKSCSQWVDKNPSKRCVKRDSTKNNAFVFQYCPQTCNRCECVHSQWLFKDKAGKNCEWVAKRPTVRCSKTGARENCKGICGGQCRKNTSGWITTSLDVNTKGNCEWFKKKAHTRW